ncbi:MAG: TatD family hydrolase [Acidobacteria bacterium]|nr:TatD family hydrolase [Acidobacteriota bacterium]
MNPIDIVDTHAHLEMPAFDADREAVIDRARDAGVIRILSVGNARPEERSMEKSLDLCSRFPGLSTSVGIHPHDASLASEAWYRRFEDYAASPHVWALGEIGLDYHYDLSPRDVQCRVFAEQLDLARALDLPVIVHSREAAEDTCRLLEAHWAPPNPGGILHCFAGDGAMARRCMALGFHVSFAGNITFPRAQGLRDALAEVPDDRLLLETDSPYLSPVPHRGKRNEPARVAEVFREAARLRGCGYTEVAGRVMHNFKNVFSKWFPTVL